MVPTLFILVLFFLPFLDRRPERRPAKRPVVMAAGIGFLVIVFGLLGISLKNLYAIPKSDPSVVHKAKNCLRNIIARAAIESMGKEERSGRIYHS